MAKFWPFNKKNKKVSLGRVSSLELNLGDEIPQYQTLNLWDSPVSGSARLRPGGGPFVREYEVSVVKGVENAARATVILDCNEAASTGDSAELPRFLGQFPITGSVELVVRDPLVVDRVGLSVQGRFTNEALGESYLFLDSPTTIWDRQQGDPRGHASSATSSSPLATRSPSVRRYDGKLYGGFSWPFSLVVPENLPNEYGAGSGLPPSYDEEGVNGKVQYQLYFTVYHGQGYVQSIASLEIPFLYAPDPPILLPPPQKTQGSSTLVTSPLEDPKAWATLPTVLIQGSLLRREITIQAEFFIGEPLCYRAGTFIPCYAVLEASDWRSLDIIATTQTMAMSLLRKTSYPISDSAPQNSHAARNLREGQVVAVCAKASWIVPQFVPIGRAKTRQFYGEIHLPEDLSPTCSSRILSTCYAVQFGSFNCPSFDQSSPRPHELQTWGVGITTDQTNNPGAPSSVVPQPQCSENVRLADVQGTPNDFSHFSF